MIQLGGGGVVYYRTIINIIPHNNKYMKLKNIVKLHQIVYKGKLYTGYNKKALLDLIWDKKLKDNKNK